MWLPSILNLVNETEKARSSLCVCSTSSLLPGRSGSSGLGSIFLSILHKMSWLHGFSSTLSWGWSYRSSQSAVCCLPSCMCPILTCAELGFGDPGAFRYQQITHSVSWCILQDLHHIKLISSGIIAKSFKISHESWFESNNELMFSEGWKLGQGTCWLESIYQGTKILRCWPLWCQFVASKLSSYYLCFLP